MCILTKRHPCDTASLLARGETILYIVLAILVIVVLVILVLVVLVILVILAAYVAVLGRNSVMVVW